MILSELFSRVVNMSLTASGVILVVLLARLVLRRAPKVFSYALWAAVLFRLLCPVSIPSPVSLLKLVDPPVSQASPVVSRVEYISPERVEAPVLPAVPEAEDVHAAPAASSAPVKKVVTLRDVLPYLWLTGAAGMLLYGLISFLRFRKHLTGALPVGGNLYLVDHLDSAFVTGLVFPKIYIPSDLPEDRMEYIVAHERHHIRRLDYIAKHLSFLALCVHWFNPLVWVAFLLSGRDMEMSCDEAVIRELGSSIRADYSESLIDLATRRVTVAGSPLAFGEGDTKRRILNLLHWKEPRKIVTLLCTVAAVIIFTACAANPEKPVVVSKNDGSFDANIVQSATQPVEQNDSATKNIQYTDSFSSTDGSVHFTLDVNEEITTAAMPVVTVEPHLLNGEDVQRIANSLFGDAVFYEQGPWLYEQFSKGELQRKLALTTPYTTGEKLIELYGTEKYSPDSDYLDSSVEVIKSFVERWTEQYENAPEDNPYGLCQWTFKNDAYYFYSEEEIAERGLSELSEGIEEVSARVQINGVPYLLTASRRDGGTYKLNSISVRITSGPSPMDLEQDLFFAKLCSDKPNDAQLAEAQQKAKQALSQMGMGEWYVDECYVEVRTREMWQLAQDQYIIHVNAVPVINGVPVIRRPQLSNMKNDNEYTSKYSLTDAQFQFSANGDLIEFIFDGAIDITETVNSNVATLSMDELMGKVKDHVALSDSGSYTISMDSIESWERDSGEKIICNVSISQLEYGLTRVKVPNTDDRFYYVPAILLSGTIDYCGADSGTVYYSGEQMDHEPIHPLVCMNAVDGSIILINNPDYE